MGQLNDVSITGNLARDPVLRGEPGREPEWALLHLVNNQSWRDRDGQKRSESTLVTVVARGSKARSAARLTRGDSVTVNGRLRQRDETYELEIVAKALFFHRVKSLEAEEAGHGARRRPSPGDEDLQETRDGSRDSTLFGLDRDDANP